MLNKIEQQGREHGHSCNNFRMENKNRVRRNGHWRSRQLDNPGSCSEIITMQTIFTLKKIKIGNQPTQLWRFSTRDIRLQNTSRRHKGIQSQEPFSAPQISNLPGNPNQPSCSRISTSASVAHTANLCHIPRRDHTMKSSSSSSPPPQKPMPPCTAL